MAEPAARRGVSDHVSGRDPVQSARRGARHEQSGLSGNWRQYGRAKRSAGIVDRPDRRCEVLAASGDRIEESGR